MTKFFNKLKKTLFLVHFPNFWDKIIFLENPALSRTTSYGFLAPSQNLEKINDIIERKYSDRQKDGWKNGKTLFYRTLPANAGGPTNLFHLLDIFKGEKSVPANINIYC